MHKTARTLALAAGASLLALSGAARAADADEVTIETPVVDDGGAVDVGVVDGGEAPVEEPKYVVDPLPDDGGIIDSGLGDETKIDVIDDTVDLTRGGDDGVIDPTERNLSGEIDNPEIMYTMAGGAGPVEMADNMADNAAEQAADQAADNVVERLATTAAAPAPAQTDPE